MFVKIVLLILLSTLAEAVLCHMTVKLIPMKHPVVLWAVHLSLTTLGSAIRFTDIQDQTIMTVIAVFVYFVLPLLCSEGRVINRLVRCVSVILVVTLAEMGASVLLIAIDPTVPLESNVSILSMPDMYSFGMYGLIIPALFMLSTLVQAGFRRLDKAGNVPVALPIVFQSALGAAVCFLMMQGFRDYVSYFSVSYTPVYNALLLIILFAFIRESESEAAADQALVLQDAAKKEAEELREQVVALESHQYELRALRHDLANQIEMVVELTNNGETERANAVLSNVKDAAKELSQAAKNASDEQQSTASDVRAIATASNESAETSAGANPIARIQPTLRRRRRLTALAFALLVLDVTAIIAAAAMHPHATSGTVVTIAVLFVAAVAIDVLTAVWINRALSKSQRAFESQTVTALNAAIQQYGETACDIRTAIAQAADEMVDQLDQASADISSNKAGEVEPILRSCLSLGRDATHRDCENTLVAAVLSVKRRK